MIYTASPWNWLTRYTFFPLGFQLSRLPTHSVCECNMPSHFLQMLVVIIGLIPKPPHYIVVYMIARSQLQSDVANSSAYCFSGTV